MTALQRIRRTWLRLGFGATLLFCVAAVAMQMTTEESADLAKLRTALEIVAILKTGSNRRHAGPRQRLHPHRRHRRYAETATIRTHYLNADAYERTDEHRRFLRRHRSS